MGTIPRGIEVLVKKAAVDPVFRKLLLEKRADAADTIGLELQPAEIAMINAVPDDQLEAIIARTVVHPKLRPIFLGTAAAVMIAAIALPSALSTCARDYEQTRGIKPDRPERTEQAGQAQRESDQQDEDTRWMFPAGIDPSIPGSEFGDGE